MRFNAPIQNPFMQIKAEEERRDDSVVHGLTARKIQRGCDRQYVPRIAGERACREKLHARFFIPRCLRKREIA